jgi:hypothetical protein
MGALAVANDEGWTVVELLGSEGEIGVGDIVFGNWNALGGEDLICRGRKYSAYFQGTGSKMWAVKMVSQWGSS